jgi:hypothetical protein
MMKQVTVTPTTTGAEFLALFNDPTIDVIELAGGEYTTGRISITIARTATPMTICPAPGATVVWNGRGGSVGAFYFGLTDANAPAPASGFTFDGRNGPGSSWLFTNYNLGSTGIFWMGGSHHLQFLGLKFAGNTGIRQGQNSHSFYISNNNEGSEAGRSHDIEIAYCQIDGSNRTVTGSQCWHNPGPYNVDFHDNQVANCDSGCVWGAVPSTNMKIRNNAFTDCDRAIDVHGPVGVASGNVSHNAPISIEAPFVDDGTNNWG